MNFPITNIRLKLTFNLASLTAGTYLPFVTNGTSTITSMTIGTGGTKLYIHKVSLPGPAQEKYASKLASGFQKLVRFKEVEYYTLPVSTSATVNSLVSSSVVRPTRVIIGVFKTGDINGDFAGVPVYDLTGLS